MPPSPLSDTRVLDLTNVLAGPFACHHLAHMGAEVIKIEPPLGDSSRYGRGTYNETPEGTLGPQFVAVNRGKRSICMDLMTDQAMTALHRFLDQADVFLTNYNLTIFFVWLYIFLNCSLARIRILSNFTKK